MHGERACRGARGGVTAHLWMGLSACLCFTSGHPRVPSHGSISQHLCRMQRCPPLLSGATLLSRGSQRDPTHLTGVKLQGLRTLFGMRPEKCSILKHLRKWRLLGSVWSL